MIPVMSGIGGASEKLSSNILISKQDFVKVKEGITCPIRLSDATFSFFPRPAAPSISGLGVGSGNEKTKMKITHYVCFSWFS
jgi:hypothetical protein